MRPSVSFLVGSDFSHLLHQYIAADLGEQFGLVRTVLRTCDNLVDHFPLRHLATQIAFTHKVQVSMWDDTAAFRS